MKKLLTAALAFLLVTITVQAQAINADKTNPPQLAKEDTITLDDLMAMDKQQFEGKTVEAYLTSPEAAGVQDILFKTGEDGALIALKVKYSDTLYLHVYLKDLQHHPALAGPEGWQLDLLKKELVEEIRVVYVMYQKL